MTGLTAPVEAAFSAVLRRWERHRLGRRLWDGDPTVWDTDPGVGELADRVGWLHLHHTMREEAERISRLPERLGEFRHVVLCGMGGSSLAPEVFASLLGRDGDLIVCDSTHPEAVGSIRGRIDPDRSVFVVSSKSGTTLETLSFFRTFWTETGGDGSRFIVVTDPGTPLEQLAEDRGFAEIFRAPPDVGGRFSALTHFGLVPAALVGVDPVGLLAAAAELAARADGTAGGDPGIPLGLAWATLALAGRDKLTFATSPSLKAFPAWMEQLLAESLGKDGTGIIPITDEPSGAYGPDRAFVVYALKDEEVPPVPDPAVVFRLDDLYGIAGEMLRAELATAAAGEVLGVHPFDQPNVEAAKRFARAAMSGELDLGSVPTLSVDEAGGVLSRAVAETPPGGYVGIHAYLPPSNELWGKLTELRARIGTATGAATTLGWGPRFLHSTGQLHKGGTPSGWFLQLVDRPSVDEAVPETDHTYGRIITAQAAGDYRALVDAGRRVVRVDLGADRMGGVEALIHRLSS